MTFSAWRVLQCACVGAAVLTGCTSNSPSSALPSRQAPASRPDRRTLPSVALPDLSHVDPAVAKQLRDARAALDAKLQDPGAGDVDLAGVYGEMGKLLLAAEYREAAAPCFLNAQALAPTDARWPYYLAHLYKGIGDSSASVAAFERALQLQPGDLATLVWLGRAYIDQGRPEDAEPLFTRALKLQPQSVAVLFGLGRAALAKQEHARAVDLLERVLSLDPKASAAHYPLGMAYRGLGNLEKAETHLRQRARADLLPPDPLMQPLQALVESAIAYEVRGTQALDEGQWQSAADYFRKGIELAPDQPALRHKLGTALAMSGDTRGAVQQFETVTRRWPAFGKAHYSLGVILAGSGKYREAIDHFRAAASRDPTSAQAELQWAEALRIAGAFGESLPHYEKAIALDPRITEAHLGRTMALAGLKRFQEARMRLTEAMKIFPGRPDFADLLARLPN